MADYLSRRNTGAAGDKEAAVWRGLTPASEAFHASPEAQAVRDLAQEHGVTEVVFVGDAPFNAVLQTLPDGTRSIVVSEIIDRGTHAQQAGHEMSHSREEDGDPEMMRLVESIDTSSEAFKSYRDMLNSRREELGLPPLNDRRMASEVAADLDNGLTKKRADGTDIDLSQAVRAEAQATAETALPGALEQVMGGKMVIRPPTRGDKVLVKDRYAGEVVGLRPGGKVLVKFAGGRIDEYTLRQTVVTAAVDGADVVTIGSKVINKATGETGVVRDVRPLEEKHRGYHGGAENILEIRWNGKNARTDGNVRDLDITTKAGQAAEAEAIAAKDEFGHLRPGEEAKPLKVGDRTLKPRSLFSAKEVDATVAKELEKLDPGSHIFSEKMQRNIAERKAWADENIKLAGENTSGVRLQSTTDPDKQILIHRSTYPGLKGKWQITYMDKWGGEVPLDGQGNILGTDTEGRAPSGHEVANTLEAAIREASTAYDGQKNRFKVIKTSETVDGTKFSLKEQEAKFSLKDRLPAFLGGQPTTGNPQVNYLIRKTRLATTPGGQKVEKMHEGGEAQWTELRSWRNKEYWNEAKRMAIDVSANLKKAFLEKAGARGQEAIMRHDLLAGASSKAKMLFDEANKEIYGGLKKPEEILLNRMIESQRTIAIEAYRPDLKHPGMLAAADHQAYLDDLRQAEPELYGKLNPRVDAYFAATKDALNALRDAGLINQEAYDAMANHAYAPREFIQHVDPDVTGFTAGGKKISVPDSGIKRLEEGSDQALNHNYRDLLSQVIGRTHARIMRNEANLALYDLAKADKNNGIVRLAFPNEKLGSQETAIHVMKNGQPVKMVMPDAYAREWVQSDPLIAAQLSNFVGWVSGAKILRAAATGMNPGFALTNIPRDIAHIWITDAKQAYSPFLPKYLAQMGRDLMDVLPDAIGRKGAWKEYINEGGGMDWLTTQGKVGERLPGVFANIQRYLGWVGETSEILTRLAIRNRNIKNGATSIEATWAARNYLDFSQGGSFTKALDSGLPYLNASIQGTRMIAKAAHSDPKLFALKVGQIGALAIGLYLANSLINPDGWDEVPESEKVTNWIITTPFSYLDEMGNKRYHYFRIAKDQGQRVFASAFEGLAALLQGKKVNGGQIASAIGDFLPLIPNEKLPPTFQAMLGYLANKDFWRNRDIWRGPQVEAQEEFNKLTHPMMIKAGGVTGLSPERLGYAMSSIIPSTNTYVALVGGGLKAMLSDLPAKDRERTLGEIIAQVPMMNKILRSTDPNVPYMKEIEESTIKESTIRLKQRREVEKIVDANIELPATERRQVYGEYIAAQGPEDVKRLVRQIKNYEAYHDLSDRRWWLALSHLTPEVRAESFYKRYKTATPDKQEELMELGKKLPGINSTAFREKLAQLDGELEMPATREEDVDKELRKMMEPGRTRKPGRYAVLGF